MAKKNNACVYFKKINTGINKFRQQWRDVKFPEIELVKSFP
jgi:hypothetical protein